MKHSQSPPPPLSLSRGDVRFRIRSLLRPLLVFLATDFPCASWGFLQAAPSIRAAGPEMIGGDGVSAQDDDGREERARAVRTLVRWRYMLSKCLRGRPGEKKKATEDSTARSMLGCKEQRAAVCALDHTHAAVGPPE